jgi:hypothetical protein
MGRNPDHINTYLWYGYLPPNEMPTWLGECITLENKGNEYTLEESAKLFDQVFDELLDKHSRGKHIIPLSGGFDSRAILGALLERLDASQIETVTFGVPGQLDYDIGLKVAKWAGVKSYALDLRSVEFTWDKLIDSVEESPWTYVPDGYFNSLARNVSWQPNNKVWSGFLGDPLTGSHLSASRDESEAMGEFVQKQCMSKEIKLIASKYNPWLSVPKVPLNDFITPYEYLDLGVRQSRCIAPIVTPVSAWNGWNGRMGLAAQRNDSCSEVMTPFANPAWAAYWLTVPRELLKDQKLYLEMLKLKYPKLFSLPSKNSLGIRDDAMLRYQLRWIRYGITVMMQRKAPWLRVRSCLKNNYLDYDEMFRKRSDYKETLDIAFTYLKDKQVTPWLDLDDLRQRHMKRRRDCGSAFNILIGLAANLEVGNPLPG